MSRSSSIFKEVHNTVKENVKFAKKKKKASVGGNRNKKLETDSRQKHKSSRTEKKQKLKIILQAYGGQQ